MEEVVIEHFLTRLKKGEYTRRKKLIPLPPAPDGRLLEIGSGTRHFYNPGNRDVHAIDIIFEMAKGFAKYEPKAHVTLADARSLPFKPNSFDVIVSHFVLHHLVGQSPSQSLHNITRALFETKRTISKDGVVVVDEFAPSNRIVSRAMFYITRFLAIFGIEVNALDIDSRVVTFFLTEDDMKRISDSAGLQLKMHQSQPWKIKGITMGTLNTYLLSANSREKAE